MFDYGPDDFGLDFADEPCPEFSSADVPPVEVAMWVVPGGCESPLWQAAYEHVKRLDHKLMIEWHGPPDLLTRAAVLFVVRWLLEHRVPWPPARLALAVLALALACLALAARAASARRAELLATSSSSFTADTSARLLLCAPAAPPALAGPRG